MANDIDISHYNTGTATIQNGGTIVTFQSAGNVFNAIRKGDLFGTHVGDGIRIKEINFEDSNIELAYPWTGPNQTNGAYEIQRTPYDLGYQKAVEDLLIALQQGNIPLLEALEGNVDLIPIFTSPNTMSLISKSSLVAGMDFDVQVDTLADRSLYDAEPEGYKVLVSDMGDGRSALFSKRTNDVGDWSDPSYITGPSIEVNLGTVTAVNFDQSPNVTFENNPGEVIVNFELPVSPTFALGDFTVLEPWEDPIVQLSQVATGYEIDLSLPASATFEIGTITTIEPSESASADLIQIEGGYRLDLSLPRGQTGNIVGVTDFWRSRLTADQDEAAARLGLGAGDVNGPTESVNERIAVFDGETGKLLKDSGALLSDIVPGENSITNEILADVPTSTMKGRIDAETGDPQDLTVDQIRTLIETLPIQSDPYDISENKALRQNAFGLGFGSIIFLQPTDSLDNIEYTGWSRVSSDNALAVGAPRASAGIILTEIYSNSNSSQIYREITGSNPLSYKRTKTSGGWSTWTRIDGDVNGPTESVNNHVAQFDGTTGKLLKDSGNPIQTSTTDTTANALMSVGAFGLGTVAVTNNDWDSINVTGFYNNSSSTATGIPMAASPLSLLHIQASETVSIQISLRNSSANNNTEIWRRAYSNGTWGSWTLINGDLNGPSSSSDNNIPQFDGITGKLLKDSGWSIQSDFYDVSTSAVLRQGAFGIGGGLALNISGTDALANIEYTGWVRVSNANAATVGAPSTSGGIVLTEFYGVNNRVQWYTEIVGQARTFRRVQINSSGYQSWTEFGGSPDIMTLAEVT